MPQASSAERFSLRATTALTVRFSLCTWGMSFHDRFSLFLESLLQPSVLESSLHLISFFFFLWRKPGKIENWPWSKRIFSLSFSLDIEEIARFLGLLLFLSLFFFYQNTSRITFCYVEMIKFVYFYVDNRNSFLP